MAVITAQSVTKVYGGLPVLTGATVSLEGGERVGLVGANGAGKSTLLKIIAGHEKPDGGTVHIARRVHLGYLPQEARFHSEKTLREAMLTVFVRLQEVRVRLRELEALLETRGDPATWDPALLQEYTLLLGEFEERGGYSYESRIEQVLGGLGFAPESLDEPASHLSGGQQTRARLARLLLEEPDFLLLDEPTNHLDLETTEWLERFLSSWSAGLVIVSHDRRFLDKVTRRTVEIIDGGAESYPAPYSRYLYLRAERYCHQQKSFEGQQAQIAKTEDFIRRYKAGQRSKEARGRQTRLDRLDRLTGAPDQRDALRPLRFEEGTRGGEVALSTVRLRIGYPGKGLLTVPNSQVARRERVALIGANGAGKSTLLRTLMGEIAPLGGSFSWGANSVVAYYSQTHEGLHLQWTALQELQEARPMSEEEARGYLGRFAFSGDDVFKKVGDLSGGERSRLALARLTLHTANLLLLDEPTNHLDIASRDALEDVLNAYNGTLIFVSHDRYFIDALATSVWVIDDGIVRAYRGTYSEYVAAREKGELPVLQTSHLDNEEEKAVPAVRPQQAVLERTMRDSGNEEFDHHVAAARGLEEERRGLAPAVVDGAQMVENALERARDYSRLLEELRHEDERLIRAMERWMRS